MSDKRHVDVTQSADETDQNDSDREEISTTFPPHTWRLPEGVPHLATLAATFVIGGLPIIFGGNPLSGLSGH